MWGLIMENPRKSYFSESYSIHVLATSGGKGVWGRADKWASGEMGGEAGASVPWDLVRS